MKPVIKAPFFEIGIKNYIYGDEVLAAALAAEAAAQKYDVDVLLITPYTEIRRVAEHTRRLIVLAPYMDVLRPGRGMADVLPEALQAAGARGVVLNHCERPMTLLNIQKTIERANELGLLTFACASSLQEARAIACLHPDIINPEPTEIIGTGVTSDQDFVRSSIQVIKEIAPDILVEQAAGITSGQQVYDLIVAGAEAAGAASGIFGAKDPLAKIDEMVHAVRQAIDDQKRSLEWNRYENLSRSI